MPRFFSAASVTLPIPGILRTASGARKASSLPAGTQTKPSRLGLLAGHFCDEARRAEPARTRKPRRRSDFAQQFMRRRQGRAVQPLGAGEIDVRLIDRGHFDDRRIFRENAGDAIAPLPVQLVVPVEKNSVRAKFRGGPQRHRRMNAESPRFVARRRDHAALVALPADDNSKSFQIRPRQQLDRDEKCVHIHMEDRRGSLGRGCCEGNRIVLGAKMSQIRHGAL